MSASVYTSLGQSKTNLEHSINKLLNFRLTRFSIFRVKIHLVWCSCSSKHLDKPQHNIWTRHLPGSMLIKCGERDFSREIFRRNLQMCSFCLFWHHLCHYRFLMSQPIKLTLTLHYRYSFQLNATVFGLESVESQLLYGTPFVLFAWKIMIGCASFVCMHRFLLRLLKMLNVGI